LEYDYDRSIKILYNIVRGNGFSEGK